MKTEKNNHHDFLQNHYCSVSILSKKLYKNSFSDNLLKHAAEAFVPVVVKNKVQDLTKGVKTNCVLNVVVAGHEFLMNWSSF